MTPYWGGGGGGAAGLSYSVGDTVSHAPADGTPRVVITYDLPAPAVRGDLVVPVADSTVSASCTFSVRGVRANTVSTKFTTKAKEIKPSYFAPRTVANIKVDCTAKPAGLPASAAFGTSFSTNSSVMYRTRYLTGPIASSYQLCTAVTYRLRSGSVHTLEDCSG